jgi:hypothetical protein
MRKPISGFFSGGVTGGVSELSLKVFIAIPKQQELARAA